MKTMHLHLVSDSTGETVSHLARASLVEFKDVEVQEHTWSMVRSPKQVEEILESIKENPGFVVYTVVDADIKKALERGCRENGLPSVSALDPVVSALQKYLGQTGHAKPGGQHVLDEEYFDRISAMDFVMTHDDGQSVSTFYMADVILLGVSRTSKTPTCIYLGNRGVKAANLPLVPGAEVPQELFDVKGPMIVGLIQDPKRLVEIRRQRLQMLHQNEETDYIDFEMVTKEINDARRLYSKLDCPVINVSRKSIEETSATIIQLLKRRQDLIE